jgi:GNAT superfamily N-acetyltransferase
MTQVQITHLEMTARPAETAGDAPLPGITIERLHAPDVQEYRVLYDAVGRDWRWMDRKRISDETLAFLIQHPRVELYVLLVNGVRAGYAELDRRIGGSVEIVYFGLTRDYIGRGLGAWFLQRVVQLAWAGDTTRVWLHTCTLDHPRALPNYVRAGFQPFKVETVEVSP